MTQYDCISINVELSGGADGRVIGNHSTDDSETGVLPVDGSSMPTLTEGETNEPTIVPDETAADLAQAEQTRQTLMAKYNVKNSGHLVYLGVGDRDW